MVCSYVSDGRTIDRSFARKAIATFEKTFPGAPYEYASVVNSVHFYTDATEHAQYEAIYNTVARQLRITSCYGSYPIADKQSVEQISSSKGTQLLIVHTNHRDNWEVLKKQFPQMSELDPADDGIISFIDSKKRPVIILNVHNISQLDGAITRMVADRSINASRIFEPI